jgi:hypothetical protein
MFCRAFEVLPLSLLEDGDADGESDDFSTTKEFRMIVDGTPSVQESCVLLAPLVKETAKLELKK